MGKKLDKKMLVFVTIGLVIILSSIMGIRVNGAASRVPDLCSEYKEIEEAYIAEIKDRLDDNGFCNAGVTLNKVVNLQGSMDYTVSVHHRRIDRMNDYQRAQISDIIIGNGVAIDDSTVSVRYIEY